MFIGQTDVNKKKIGFKVGNISYSEANPVYNASTNRYKDKIVPGTPKVFEKTLKLNEFVVQGLTANDFTVATDYFDADGDREAIPAFTSENVSHEWFDSNGNKITNEEAMMGCSGFSQPLTLRIKLDVKAHSKYGAPRDSDPTLLEQSYQIKTTSGICFAKPNSWDFWGGETPSPIYGGGYESSQFVPNYGFKASLVTKFPTTGFPGAFFYLMMTSNASDYTFSSNSSAVTVDTSGRVTLNSKPSGAVTIKAIYKSDTNQVHYYTFNPTTLWVRPTGVSSKGTYTWAKGQCGGESKIPTRAQLTNSPQKTASKGNTSIPTNYYTRAVGGGIFGEWGVTNSSVYPGSQWALTDMSSYWTRDVHSSSVKFTIFARNGYVSYIPTFDSDPVACVE
ncbi:hypothetical protein RCS94_02480 [Orbaceae bacterium ac157xtp]